MTVIIPGGTGPLQKYAKVVLDAQGAGEAIIGPVPPGQTWYVTARTITVTGTNDPMPVCRTYRGPAVAQNFLDGTYTGGLDTNDTPLILRSDEFLTFAWAGGVPGSTASALVIGEQSA